MDDSKDFAFFIQTIQAKQPKLTVAIADACNNFVNDWKIERLLELQSVHLSGPSSQYFISNQAINLAPLIEKDERSNIYCQLFIYQSGTIVISSCSPGEIALKHTTNGGFFTQNFLRSLRGLIKASSVFEAIDYHKECMWTILLQTTQFNLEKSIKVFSKQDSCVKQTIQYELSLR